MKTRLIYVITAMVLLLSLTPLVAEAKTCYGAGDSIMEGWGNGYIGTCDTMSSMYGYRIICDPSRSGTLMTPNTFNPNNVISTDQYNTVSNKLATYGYDKDTIIIIDGGGNDSHYLVECIDRGINLSTSIDNICFCTGMMLYNLAVQVGNTNPNQGYKVPIYFIIPSIQNPYFNTTDTIRITNFTYVARQTQTITDMADLGVVCVNMNDICKDYNKTMYDVVHPNWYGYKLICEYIHSH